MIRLCSFDCIFWLVVEHLVATDLVVSFAVKSSSGRSELLLGELWFLIFKFFDVHLVPCSVAFVLRRRFH